MIASSHRNTSSAHAPLHGAVLGSRVPNADAWLHVSGVLNVEQVSQAVQQVALDYHLQVINDRDARHISLTYPEESVDCNAVEIRWRLLPASPPSILPYQVRSETGLEVLITHKGTSMEEPAIALGKLLESYVLPYSATELDSIVASMPLVLHYSSYDEVLANWALIFRDHYLEHSIGFVLGMERAGIPAEWIFTLTKGDRTRNRDRVHATFLARGYRSDILDNAVVDYPDDGPNSAQLVRVSSDIDAFIDRAHAAGRKVLVVDDGGLVACGYAALTSSRRVDAAVELTVSGLKRIRAAGPLAIPILNMARSQVKTHLGYLEIADSCMRRLRSILPAQKFIGRPVLLLGFGTLGSRLAPALRALGCQVSVVDTDILALIAAAEAGYTTYPNATSALRAIRPFLIIGTTGEMALTPDDLPYIPDRVHLAPFATRGFSIFTNPMTAPPSADIPGVGRCYILADGRECILLGDGRSLNLFEADSIPNQGYDAYRAGTIIAIKDLCATHFHLVPGLHADVVDSAIARAGLYEAYYERYLVPSPTSAAITAPPLLMES